MEQDDCIFRGLIVMAKREERSVELGKDKETCLDMPASPSRVGFAHDILFHVTICKHEKLKPFVSQQ